MTSTAASRIRRPIWCLALAAEMEPAALLAIFFVGQERRVQPDEVHPKPAPLPFPDMAPVETAGLQALDGRHDGVPILSRELVVALHAGEEQPAISFATQRVIERDVALPDRVEHPSFLLLVLAGALDVMVAGNEVDVLPALLEGGGHGVQPFAGLVVFAGSQGSAAEGDIAGDEDDVRAGHALGQGTVKVCENQLLVRPVRRARHAEVDVGQVKPREER